MIISMKDMDKLGDVTKQSIDAMITQIHALIAENTQLRGYLSKALYYDWEPASTGDGYLPETFVKEVQEFMGHIYD